MSTSIFLKDVISLACELPVFIPKLRNLDAVLKSCTNCISSYSLVFSLCYCLCFETGSPVTQADFEFTMWLELLILLPPLAKCWSHNWLSIKFYTLNLKLFEVWGQEHSSWYRIVFSFFLVYHHCWVLEFYVPYSTLK